MLPTATVVQGHPLLPLNLILLKDAESVVPSTGPFLPHLRLQSCKEPGSPTLPLHRSLLEDLPDF